jgi:hypothetical protein
VALWAWATTTSTVAAGVIIMGLTPYLGLSGAELLIGPLLVALGLTIGAVIAGLHNAWGVIGLFAGVEVVFIVLKFINPWGIGAVV